MSIDINMIEVERAGNVVKAFEWRVIEKKFEPGGILIVVAKDFKDISEGQREVDKERIINLLSGFGWILLEEVVHGSELLLSLRKPISEELARSAAEMLKSPPM